MMVYWYTRWRRAAIKLPFNPDLPPASRCKQQQPHPPTGAPSFCRGCCPSSFYNSMTAHTGGGLTKFISDLDSTLSTLPFYDEGLCKRYGYEVSALRRGETYHHTTSLPLLYWLNHARAIWSVGLYLRMTLSIVHWMCWLSMVVVVRMMCPILQGLWVVYAGGIVFHESKKLNQMFWLSGLCSWIESSVSHCKFLWRVDNRAQTMNTNTELLFNIWDKYCEPTKTNATTFDEEMMITWRLNEERHRVIQS